MATKVSEASHGLLISTAQELLATTRFQELTLSDIYRAAGVSKATAYRDAEFRDWWKKQTRDQIVDRHVKLKVELTDLKNRNVLLQEDNARLEKEITLARTIMAAQSEQIRNITMKTGKVVGFPENR